MLTKRNHYNPCFWTALWNADYFGKSQIDAERSLAREQVVYVLNVKARKLLQSTVERVHYDKNLGIAEITKGSAIQFVRRYHPERLHAFINEAKSTDYPVYIDLESLLTGIENMAPYETLLKVALTQNVDNLIEKTNLANFVALHCLRSHAVMNSMIEWHEDSGSTKFEHFVTLKWMLSDPTFLFRLVHPLLCSQWNLFTSPEHQLPLCDSPILVSPKSTMIALSPRLLLEIVPHIRTTEDASPTSRRIGEEKLEEYRRRTIGNTFRELIGEREILEQWCLSSELQARSAAMRDVKKYNKMVYASGDKQVWQLNAYGNAS